MKLYATVTSERATKGQGGNKYLKIEITNDKKERLAMITVEPKLPSMELQSIRIDYDRYISHVIKIPWDDWNKEQRGKKQKGECVNKDSNGNACYDCECPSGFPCGSTPNA